MNTETLTASHGRAFRGRTTPAGKSVDRHGDTALSPSIDSDALSKRCLGNVSFALVLLGEFEATGTQQVDEIALLVVGNDPQAAADAAHSLVGAAAIIGAESIRALAAEIEAVCRGGEALSAVELVNELRGEMDRCLTDIPRIRTEMQRQ